MSANVLVVDDDPDIRALARLALIEGGLTVSEAADGPSGIEAFHAHQPELILLDIGLGSMDGFEVCRRIRSSSSCPIIFLTSRIDDVDQLVGFEAGADDYVGKPFSPRLLAARVQAVLRRGQRDEQPAHVLDVEPLMVDLDARRATAAGAVLDLTRIEFDLLAALMERPRQVFSREQLLESVWGSTFYDGHVVEVHMSRLRGKVLAAAGINIGISVRGVGYRLGIG